MVGTLGCSAGTAPSDDSSPRVGAEVPAAALTRLARAWDAGDEAAAADLASPGDADARELLAIPARNVRALGLRDVRLERSTPGSARVSWRMPAVDSSPSRVNVRVRVTGRGLAIEPTTTSPMPLWLTEPQLTEREVGSVRVLGAPQHNLARILGDARRARSVVRRAWPTWDGRLVVEVASSQQRMAAALGRSPAAYNGIAAVTSSSDGTTGSTTPVHVFVNPLVYAGMSAQAARVVMAHEVVHVATRAPVTPVPLWWAEGVAEHLGFAAVALPVARSLSAAARADLLARITRHGPPRRLPGPAAFAGPHRDAAYATARVAVAVLADLEPRSGRSSEQALAQFQARLAAGTELDSALRAVFGIDRDAFIGRWRAALVRMTL